MTHRSALVALILALAGCRPIGLSADGSHVDWSEQGQVTVAIQGDIGGYRDIDAAVLLEREDEDGWVIYWGDVFVGEGSVYVEVTIANPDGLPIGEELHAGSGEDELRDSAIDVYACPDFEGVSGNADDIFVTRLEQGDLVIGASASAPEQNLDVAIQLLPSYAWAQD